MNLNWCAQLVAVTVMTLRNMPQRAGSSFVAVCGTTCVVGVFIGVLSMSAGFQRTMLNAGSAQTVIFLRAGATSEMTSSISDEQAELISSLPGLVSRENDRLASPELFVVADIPEKRTGNPANVSMRGVRKHAAEVRDGFRLTSGRMFRPGTNELIVGVGARHAFAGLEPGSTVKLGQVTWRIVGAFSAGGGLSESELWCDDRSLQAAYRRGNGYQSVRVRMPSAEYVQQIQTLMHADLRLSGIEAKSEIAYLTEQSAPLTQLIHVIGYPLALVMALGATFAAINTMYSSVSGRTREIATLRAIGFGRISVVVSTVAESLTLALIGTAVGSALVYLLLNGHTVAAMNSASFSQVVFNFAVTPALVRRAASMALIIGLAGAAFPAMRAVRQPIAVALRER